VILFYHVTIFFRDAPSWYWPIYVHL